MPDSLQILIRAISAYILLFTITRIMGKRQISQLTFFDYVVGITIGSITANLTVNLNNSFVSQLPALFFFGSMQIFLSIITLRNKKIRYMLEGKPAVLIENGKIINQNLEKERIDIDELMSMLREKNVFNLNDVSCAYLETNGKLSVLKKDNKLPITPKDLNLVVSGSNIGHLVIEDGQVNEEKLKQLGLTRSWLTTQINSQGITNISDVMHAQVDASGKVYIDINPNRP